MKNLFIVFYRWVILLMGVLSAREAAAQFWPPPFDLSQANYSSPGWSAAAAAGTYPPSMKFYFMKTTADPTSVDTAAEVYTGAYNLNTATRISGKGSRGFSFINTTTSPVSDSDYKLGTAVLALNTTDRDSVQVSWTGHTITANARNFIVRLYYRTGDSGSWTAAAYAGGNYMQYLRSPVSGDSVVLAPLLLPDSLWHQPLVQLQWKYFVNDTNTATGSRPEMAVSGISVTSTGAPFPPVPHFNISTDSLPAFITSVGNYSRTDSFLLSGNLLVSNATISADSTFEVSTDPLNFSGAVSLPVMADTLEDTWIYVRFVPQAKGWKTGLVNIVSGSATVQVHVKGYGSHSRNPAPVVLAANDYNFSYLDSFTAPGSYPPGTAFQVTDTVSPALNYLPMPDDWHCGYTLSSRSRFWARGQYGVAFVNTASPQYDNCVSGAASENIFTGAVVAAVNTMGIDAATLSYTQQILAKDGSVNARAYALRLQMRTDTAMPFEDVTPLHEMRSSDQEALYVENVSFDLPQEWLGRPYVQFRWLFYDLNIPNGSGSRPQFRLDNVVIKKKTPGGLSINDRDPVYSVRYYPNPVKQGEPVYLSRPVSGSICNVLGQMMATFSRAGKLSTRNLAAGIYFVRLSDGSTFRLCIE